MLNKKVSVIIPFYGVEKYIRRCVISLMNQTLKDVEFIFVDDCSNDNSARIVRSVIAEYPIRQAQVKIVRHDKNKGLPASRNTGLAKVEGEYVYHCDSDDYLEPDMLERMYNAAKTEDADFIWCDYFLSYSSKQRYMSMPKCDSPYDTVEKMLIGAMKYNVWNKLVKRSLYVDNDIWFPAGFAMGEDMTMIRLASCAKKVAYVPFALYHYVRTNDEAMTQTVSKDKLMEMQHNVNVTTKFISGKTADHKCNCELFKLQAKFPLLITDDKDLFKSWSEIYPESNVYIGGNGYESYRAVILQKLAKDGHFWLISLYYKIVYKFLYQLIYS